MAKNTNRTRNANVVMPLTIAGAKSGDVVPIGDQGLMGYALTDTYTTPNPNSGLDVPPQGLASGQASIEVIGVSRVVELTIAGSPDVGDPIFRVTADGTYTATANGNKFIGYFLGAGLVGLVTFTPAPVGA